MTTRLEKPVRREMMIHSGWGGRSYVVSMTVNGLELRQKGHRVTLTVPWRDVLARAEHLAGEHRRREQLRSAVVRRLSRDRR